MGHAMYNTKVIRPSADIDSIAALIKNNPNAITLQFVPGTKFDMVTLLTPSVILIESGSIALYRKYDDKLILDFNPPFPFGITESSSAADNYYLIANTESRVTLLDKRSYYATLKDSDILMSMLRIVNYLIDVAEERQRINVQFTNSYDIIKHCLGEIWATEECKRETVSIYDYIMSRHRMSRSSITKIIKSLNDGGYIVSERGILKNLKNLPVRY